MRSKCVFYAANASWNDDILVQDSWALKYASIPMGDVASPSSRFSSRAPSDLMERKLSAVHGTSSPPPVPNFLTSHLACAKSPPFLPLSQFVFCSSPSKEPITHTFQGGRRLFFALFFALDRFSGWIDRPKRALLKVSTVVVEPKPQVIEYAWRISSLNDRRLGSRDCPALFNFCRVVCVANP